MTAEVRRADVAEHRDWAPRRTILLTRECNNGCVFCGQPSATESSSEHEAHLDALRALASISDEVTFVGGEPLLDARLVALVASARGLGFRAIGVQTNGRLLARGDLARDLAAAGLTDVHVSIHGSDVAVHDYHTGTPGSLSETIAGVAKARAAKLTVVATTVLTRSNYRSLALLPRLLASRSVSAWQIAVPHARGRAFDRFDRVYPRLGLAIPFALHAMNAAAQLGLPAFLTGAPLCMLGPFANRAMPIGTDDARGYAAVCDACPSRSRCPGVDPHYLERFAADELSACNAAAPLAQDAVARLFTGLGDRAPLPEAKAPAHEAPRTARLRLPVLSRPQPGAQEARRVEPKTGEALREILPTLFDGKTEP